MTDSNVTDVPADTPKITSSTPEKIKDPKRVAAGKRLAQISKAANEKKARERFEAERAAEEVVVEEEDRLGWDIDFGLIIGTISVLVSIGGLNFTYKSNQSDTDRRDGTVRDVRSNQLEDFD